MDRKQTNNKITQQQEGREICLWGGTLSKFPMQFTPKSHLVQLIGLMGIYLSKNKALGFFHNHQLCWFGFRRKPKPSKVVKGQTSLIKTRHLEFLLKGTMVNNQIQLDCLLSCQYQWCFWETECVPWSTILFFTANWILMIKSRILISCDM